MAGKILTKIDWFTAVFYDCTLSNILSHFPDIDKKITKTWEEIWSERVLKARGYCYDVNLSVCGCCITLLYDKALNPPEDLNVLTTKFSDIRLDISGSGLDELRAMGYNMDSILFREWVLPEGCFYHVTRCDFAFDLLDHCTHFLDTCFEWVYQNNDGMGKVKLASTQQGIAFTIFHGNSECLVLGGASSQKKLKIYDKGYQCQQMRCANLYPDMWSERWIRIELQLRRDYAHNILYAKSERDFMPVFRYIYDTFAFRASSKMGDLSNVWQELFDWSVIPSIIQNANTAEYAPVVKRATNWLKSTAFGNMFIYCSHYGYDALISLISFQLHLLNISTLDSSRRKLNALIDKAMHDTGDLPDHLKFKAGTYYIE